VLATSDKTGIVRFGSALQRLGWELTATTRTAAVLEAAGVDVTPVASLLQTPELLGGRLKTLDLRLFGGLLYRRDHRQDREMARARAFIAVELVACTFYPFAAAARAGAQDDELIELIDVGGPSMVRAAAKNFRWVLPLVDPDDYESVIRALEPDGDPRRVDETARRRLSAKAFAHMARYDAGVARALWPDVPIARVSVSTRSVEE
jgi:phosphoribosylaminoimidazolecarboxamide formyltransferase/IMP cyclohydrolase